MQNKKLSAGLCLRLEYFDDFVHLEHDVEPIEVIADNWLSPGPHHKALKFIVQKHPLHFHCVNMNVAGVDPLNFNYLTKIKKLMTTYKPVHISDHLCFQRHKNKLHHDLLPFAYNKDSLNRVCERVEKIQDYLGVPLGLENLSYYLEFKSSTLTEAQFLNEVCEKTGAFMLLDLNNLWVNNKNLNKDPITYLKTINFKFVKEIHLAGASVKENLTVDDHGADINQETLNLLKHCLPLVQNPCVFFYERDTNLSTFDKVLDEYKKIKELIHAFRH